MDVVVLTIAGVKRWQWRVAGQAGTVLDIRDTGHPRPEQHHENEQEQPGDEGR